METWLYKICITLLEYNPVSGIILTVRLKSKKRNITSIPVFAPTNTSEEEDIQEFYSGLQNTI